MNAVEARGCTIGTRKKTVRGLTLLEVLAAVMIFAMVMTVLVSTSSNAVHHVGVSARRLEADLVVDSLLAELEVQIKQGLAPPIDKEEFISEQYSIRMVMTDLVPAEQNAAVGGALSLVASALPEVVGYLKQYDIEVSWIEPRGAQSVRRTTFAFDWQSAQAELATLIDAAGSAASGISGLGDAGTDGQAATGSGLGTASGSRAKKLPAANFGIKPPPTRFNGRNARMQHLRRLAGKEI